MAYRIKLNDGKQRFCGWLAPGLVGERGERQGAALFAAVAIPIGIETVGIEAP